MARHSKSGSKRINILQHALFALTLIVPGITLGQLSPIEQIPIDAYKKMREVERYQMKIAEKYYLKKEYKVAMDEYEKYLSLYEESTGAPYAQLMWSQCLVKQRKVNTAIREGFQSVIDYWPDSPEAKSAEYLIARSYQDMGEVKKAKAAYRVLIENDAKSRYAIYSRSKLLELARVEKDETTTLQILEELTYKTARNQTTKDTCAAASRDLARHHAKLGDLTEMKRALVTTYPESHPHYNHHVYNYSLEGLRHLLHTKAEPVLTKPIVDALLEQAESEIPLDLSEEKNRNLAYDALGRIMAIHNTLGDKEQVFKTLERSEKLLGSTDRILGQLANYYKHNGDRPKARKTYLRFKNQTNAKNAIAQMFREESKFQEAIDTYQELIQVNPEGINNYLWAIAECHEGKKDWKSAIQSYRQTDRYPSNYWRMAQCHRRLKQWDEALSLYNQIKSSKNQAADATLHIGHTYEQAGQRENAIKAFQLTCRNYPKSSSASRAHAHLQSKYKITATFGGAKD